MKIKTNDESVIAHGKVNLPDVGVVDVSEDGIVEVSDELAAQLILGSNWNLVNEEDAERLGVVVEDIDDEDLENVDNWVEHVLTQAEIDGNEILQQYGLKEGDIIGIPMSAIAGKLVGVQEEPEADEEDDYLADDPQTGADDEDEDEEEDPETSEEQNPEDEGNENGSDDKGTQPEENKVVDEQKKAEERSELKKDLLRKTVPQLHDYAAALELPASEWQSLNKVPLVNYILEKADD